MPKVKSRKTWHLTTDRKRAVPETDSAGALLLVSAGCEIEAAELERYGLLPDGSDYASVAEPEPVAENAAPRGRTRKTQV